MHRTRLAVAAVLVLVGLLWLGQGSGFLPGTAMSGSAFWAVVGLVALAIGLYVGWGALRRPRAG